MTTIEICVEDEAGVAAAVAGGADRIELCGALALGGLTPSVALLRRALVHARPAGVAVHAMVRPRAGDFAYNADEVALAIDEAQALLAAGADGLVFGACRQRQLDEAVLARWTAAFPAVPSTLHRAIDLVDDPAAAVDRAVALGFVRILSSGGAATALEGADVLRAMVAAARGRCRIAAGAGVRAANAAVLIARSGVDELHGSAAVSRPSPEPAVIAMGFAAGAGRRTDPDEVRALCAAVRTQTSLMPITDQL